MGSTTAAAAGKEKKAKKAKKEKRDAGDVGEPTRKKSKKTSKSGVDAVGETVAEENRIEVKVDGILSETTFASLELSAPTMKGIESMGFKTMTEVQARCVPPLLAGKDVLGAATRRGAAPADEPRGVYAS